MTCMVARLPLEIAVPGLVPGQNCFPQVVEHEVAFVSPHREHRVALAVPFAPQFTGDHPAGVAGQAIAAADQTLTSMAVTYMKETPAAKPAIVAGAVSAAGPLPSDLIRYAVTSTMTCKMAPAPIANASADHCGA
jgi:hypothetical protein